MLNKLFSLLSLIIISNILSCSSSTSSNDNNTGTLTDIDGNVYTTIKIGAQWWMAENLKVTHYRNGATIPNITDEYEWVNIESGAYCAFNNDSSNIELYGLLYNWYTVVDTNNIAPAGWHVPTDAEWCDMEMALGMSREDADSTGWRGTDEGTRLKATSGWNCAADRTNTSGFTALPGGYRYHYSSGSFSGLGDFGCWWSTTQFNSDHLWFRQLNCGNPKVYRYHYNIRYGFSVRCVKD